MRLYLILYLFFSCILTAVAQDYVENLNELHLSWKAEYNSYRKKTGKVFQYQNPITSGIDTNGVRDCQVFWDRNRWYMTATSFPHWESQETNGQLNKGVVLYSSKDLKKWKFVKYVVPRPEKDKWYYHRFWAPEIHKIKGKYYALFSCRNDSLGYKGQYGGYAVSDRISGPYRVVTDTAPLVEGNDLTFFEDTDGQVWAFWRYGRGAGIRFAKVNLEKGELVSDPETAITSGVIEYSPDSEAKTGKDSGYIARLDPAVANYRSWDAIGIEGPYVIKVKATYYLFYSSWTRGYEVGYATAPKIKGPWTKNGEPFYGMKNKELCLKRGFTWDENPENPFIHVGHNQVFLGADGHLWLSCHGIIAGKKPMLVIDPILFEQDGTIQKREPSYTLQTVPIVNR